MNRMSPGEMLANLLDLRGSSLDDTVEFKKYQHDNDLCPRFQRNVDAILTAYDGYRANERDIQGFTNEGGDVLFTYEDADETRRRAALHIKSYKEFETSKGNKATPLSNTLINQHSRAIYNAQAGKYYIVLCADAIKHRSQIRRINSAFKNYQDVHIFTLEKALASFKLSVEQITLQVTRILCNDDYLLREARREIEDESRTAARFIIALTCRALSGDATIGTEDIMTLADECGGGDDDEEILNVINEEEFGGVLQRTEGDDFTILIDRLPTAICALYFDQKVRHHPREVVFHLYGLLIDDDEPDSDTEADDS